MGNPIERLEARRLLSVTIHFRNLFFADLRQEVFSGTRKNDTIMVTAGSRGEAVVDVNGAATVTSSGKLVISANAGSDYVHIDLPAEYAHWLITIHGGGGDDLIIGSAAAERVIAGDGNDVVLGNDGRDTIYGEAGDDFLRGGGGSDLLDGGDGADTVFGDAGNDNVNTGANPDRVRAGPGNDRVNGGGGRDVLSGDDGNDSVMGLPGDDIVAGGEGDDSVDGGVGNDIVAGGAGDDTCLGSSGADQVSGGAGIDTFHAFGWYGVDDAEMDEILELKDVPPAPSKLTFTRPAGLPFAVDLAWTYENEEVREFQVERSQDGGATWTEHYVTENAHQRSARIADLPDAASHVFRIRAISIGEIPSGYSPVTAPVQVESVPVSNLTASPWADRLDLTWNDYSTAESGSELYMRKGTSGAFAKTASFPGTATRDVVQHTAANLTGDTDYQFFVRALYAGGEKFDSEVRTFRTLAPRVDIGETETDLPPDEVYTLRLNVLGADPTTFRWAVDWGDYSPIQVVEAGADPQELVLEHLLVGDEYPKGFFIQVTATRPGLSLEGSKLVTIYAR